MSPAEWPIALNVGVFCASGAVVWFAGVRLAHYADAISEETGVGGAMIGMLLLGGVTSLPELAVAVTATLEGAPALTINDVLGSAAINIVILAIADAVVGRGALTSMPGTPAVMLPGVLGILIMAASVGSFVAGDVLFAGVGVWCWLMLAIYLLALRLMSSSQAERAWRPTQHHATDAARETGIQRSLPRLIALTVVAGAFILIAGFMLARTGEALATRTGLGHGFFGAVFLGLTTSLPEVSTVIATVRLGRYEMAISEVFGTNLFNVTIIVLVDALHPGGPVLLETGRTATFGALLALVLTAIFMIGVLERRNRAFLRMGIDSIAVVVTYAAGVLVLYGLR